jgi:hypothetical protein
LDSFKIIAGSLQKVIKFNSREFFFISKLSRNQEKIITILFYSYFVFITALFAINIVQGNGGLYENQVRKYIISVVLLLVLPFLSEFCSVLQENNKKNFDKIME